MLIQTGLGYAYLTLPNRVLETTYEELWVKAMQGLKF